MLYIMCIYIYIYIYIYKEYKKSDLMKTAQQHTHDGAHLWPTLATRAQPGNNTKTPKHAQALRLSDFAFWSKSAQHKPKLAR